MKLSFLECRLFLCRWCSTCSDAGYSPIPPSKTRDPNSSEPEHVPSANPVILPRKTTDRNTNMDKSTPPAPQLIVLGKRSEQSCSEIIQSEERAVPIPPIAASDEVSVTNHTSHQTQLLEKSQTLPVIEEKTAVTTQTAVPDQIEKEQKFVISEPPTRPVSGQVEVRVVSPIAEEPVKRKVKLSDAGTGAWTAFPDLERRISPSPPRKTSPSPSPKRLSPSPSPRTSHSDLSMLSTMKSVSENEEAFWEPNEKANNCRVCDVQFTMLNRKHHCRRCGVLVCDACSQSRDFISKAKTGSKVRICDDCMGIPHASLGGASLTEK
eukprot:TRINITY_DN17204_c0_g3_i2.p1 TRINITY_DN17204_c0_g3~~TRINITY_DN17204_c0_g3_i2.p1  ORF type:complete len:322 (+),score=41.20 TRINITY_DN17204_c0_g3_i2:408-1373(+)